MSRMSDEGVSADEIASTSSARRIPAGIPNRELKGPMLKLLPAISMRHSLRDLLQQQRLPALLQQTLQHDLPLNLSYTGPKT